MLPLPHQLLYSPYAWPQGFPWLQAGGQNAYNPTAAGYGWPASGYSRQAPSLVPALRVRDPEIAAALYVLEQTVNLPRDEALLKAQGVNILFRNGREALERMRQLGVRVEFGDTGDPKAHAVWIQPENRIVINHQYRGTMSLPVHYAIAAAIYHEAGHITGNADDESSIQEEIDCLALNAMAYRAHVVRNPEYAKAVTRAPYRRLFDDGVALYARLFFDADPLKRTLVNRIIEKYGMLAPESPGHRIPHLPYNKALAERVVMEIHRRNAQLVFGAHLPFKRGPHPTPRSRERESLRLS